MNDPNKCGNLNHGLLLTFSVEPPYKDKDVCLRAETKKKVKEERDKEEKKRAKRKAEQLAKGVEAEGDENEKKRSRAEDEPARANSTDKPNLTCEHCNKTFAISRGLEYHLGKTPM